MVDDSNLDYLRTLLGLIHTTGTVKHYSEERVIEKIAGSDRMLVWIGEITSIDGKFYKETFKVQISETNEANLTTAINNIMIGIDKFNRRQVIAGWTYADYPTLCNIHLIFTNKAYEDPISKRWTRDIYLDIKWATS